MASAAIILFTCAMAYPTEEPSGNAAQGVAETVTGSDLWAFQPVRKPAVPNVPRPEWQENPIDAFVFDRLAREGLEPVEPADRRVLIRRITFDLTG